jgi:hypothetical protein
MPVACHRGYTFEQFEGAHKFLHCLSLATLLQKLTRWGRLVDKTRPRTIPLPPCRQPLLLCIFPRVAFLFSFYVSSFNQDPSPSPLPPGRLTNGQQIILGPTFLYSRHRSKLQTSLQTSTIHTRNHDVPPASSLHPELASKSRTYSRHFRISKRD